MRYNIILNEDLNNYIAGVTEIKLTTTDGIVCLAPEDVKVMDVVKAEEPRCTETEDLFG